MHVKKKTLKYATQISFNLKSLYHKTNFNQIRFLLFISQTKKSETNARTPESRL